MDTNMPHYPKERKAFVLGKLLPPHNRPVPEIAKAEGISEATLYNWLKQARQKGVPVPGSISNSPEDWSGEAKFAVVLETAPLNAGELSEYCRAKGLYAEQVARWRQACIEGAATQEKREQTAATQLKAAHQQIRALEKDLRRKEKALAESAALLVLQKKFNTLWEDAEG
jgi:transposase-like protein